MAVQHAVFTQAFCTGGQHVLLANFFQKRIFCQHGDHCKRAQHTGQHRQGDVPEVVHHLAAPAELLPVGRGQAAQGKPLQLPAKHHQQSHAQNKARNGITDQHQQAGEGVKSRAGANRLGNAQRHGYQVTEKKRPQAQTDGHGQLFLNQAPDVLGVEKALTQIELGKLFEHHPEPLDRWFVKAVEGFDFGNAGGVHALSAAVTASRCRSALPACVAPLQLRDHLLHRATGHKLDHHKGHQQNPEQGRNHQQQAFENVGQHGSRGFRGGWA